MFKFSSFHLWITVEKVHVVQGQCHPDSFGVPGPVGPAADLTCWLDGLTIAVSRLWPRGSNLTNLEKSGKNKGYVDKTAEMGALDAPPPCLVRVLDSPHSLCVTARLDYSKGFRSTPVPEMEFVVGGDEEELSSGVEGQWGDGHVTFCKPALTATLQTESMWSHLKFHKRDNVTSLENRRPYSHEGPRCGLHHQGTQRPQGRVLWGGR